MHTRLVHFPDYDNIFTWARLYGLLDCPLYLRYSSTPRNPIYRIAMDDLVSENRNS